MNFNLCKLKYYGNEPIDDHIILSCCLFKLNDPYKDMSIYYNGLINIIKYINESKYKFF